MPKGDGTNVLIAGAGPVGLALARDLGLRGIDCVLVEQGDGKLRVPRMSSVSARGMEFCRSWGIDGKELWRLSVFHDPNPGLTGASYLRKLAGCAFPYGILDVSPWPRRDFPARTSPPGRVRISGAAAHH